VRAKFVVRIKPVGVDEYPTDEAFVKRLWNIGLGNLAERGRKYDELRGSIRNWPRKNGGICPVSRKRNRIRLSSLPAILTSVS
jgi:hypothetical protein